MTNEEEDDKKTVSEDLSEPETIDELEDHLRLLIEINSNLQQTIKYLGQLNTELCKIISSVNNISFVCDVQCKKINDSLQI